MRPAFQVPSRHELSTPLLLGIYAAIVAKVKAELSKHKWLTTTPNMWSREQGSPHMTDYHAAVPGVSCMDMTTASTEQVTGASSCLAGQLCLPWRVINLAACFVASLEPLCTPYTAFLTCLQHASWRTSFWRSSARHNLENKDAAFVTDMCACPVMNAAWVLLTTDLPMLMCLGLPSPHPVALHEGYLQHASGGSHNLNPLQYSAPTVLWVTFCNNVCIS